ncbi:hypothetical protein GCM10022261_18340 [Brevibacterium daeguense]|uniref:PIN domain-containing protein n=1 Tax=Brevibacterium daeguense TaxID=909936 RepID=A0ABP8EK35_9MICO|nr:hypothetical protein [Brevibacterium daeguense]
MSTPLRALVDTSVLLSDPLREWMLRLVERVHAGAAGNAVPAGSDSGGCAPVPAAAPVALEWTKDIQREFWAGLKHRHPEWSTGQRRVAERAWLRTCSPQPISGYQRIIRAHVRDAEDAHLDSAAEHAGVDLLVTDDTRAFRPTVQSSYRIASADEFLCLLADLLTVQLVTAEVSCEDPETQARLLRSSGAVRFAERVHRQQ